MNQLQSNGPSASTEPTKAGPIFTPPADILEKLHATIAKAARVPAVQQRLAEAGLEPELIVDTPALMAETRALSERNAVIVKKFRIQSD